MTYDTGNNTAAAGASAAPVADSASQTNVTPPETPHPRWKPAARKRVLVFIGIGFILPIPLVLALLHFGFKGSFNTLTVSMTLPLKAITAFFAILATVIVARMEERPLADFGMSPRTMFGARFWEGAVWGYAMLFAILLVLRTTGHFRIESMALAGAAAWRYAAGWALVFLAVSISEEFMFRGYWLWALARRLRFWPAAIITSIVFAVVHLGNPGENALGILQVVATGLLFCLMIRRTGTLWFALGYHAAWDWAETFFYGTPDSGMLGVGRLLNTSVAGPAWLTGGSAGPEGSILAFAVIGLCALLLMARFPKALYPDRPGVSIQ